MHEPVVQTVVLVRWGFHVTRDQHRDNQGVDGDDSGHDYRDEGLVRKGVSYRGERGKGRGRGMGRMYTFIIRSERKVPTPAMPMPDLAVP